MNKLSSNRRLTGSLAAFTVTLIWAMWLVVSRIGAQTTLTAYDLTAIRYGVSAIASLPIVLYFKPWRTLSVQRIAGLSMLLGPVYILCFYSAFDFAPAAHGGIFMNGVMPATTLLLSYFLLRQSSTSAQILGVVLILFGTALGAADVSGLAVAGAWKGDLLFIVAALFFSGYLVAARAWSITPTQVMLCSSIVNAVYFVPLWFFFLPSGIVGSGIVGSGIVGSGIVGSGIVGSGIVGSGIVDSGIVGSGIAGISFGQLTLQIFYQGLLPGLVGLILVAIATKNIGPAATSAFIAAVPGLSAILGMIFLDEIPGAAGWLSLAVLTVGILLVSLTARTR